MKAPATAQAAVSYLPASLNAADENQSIAVPAFTINIPSWPSASYITHIIKVALQNDFQLKLPIPDNAFYVLAVKWYNAGAVTRYKLWTTGTEVLSYPIYNGEVIPANCELEVWCCPNGLNLTVSAQNLLVDLLATASAESTPASVCSIGGLTTLDEMFLTCLA